MEPRIQYAKTADGVDIAYWMIGEGRTLIAAWGFPTHLQLEWQSPAVRAAIERAAQRFRVIRYDPRGCGLSDREVGDFSLDAMVRDLEAVADRSGTGKAVLEARMELTPVAISFAARHPERVSHLVLNLGFAKGADFWTKRLEALVRVAQNDWELATEGLMASTIDDRSQPGVARGLAALMRESVTAKAFVSFMRQLRDWDVSHLLPSISIPTLVIHGEHRYVSVDLARKLSALLPNARLVVGAEGENEFDAVGRAVGRFVGEDEEPRTRALTTADVRTILFTDIESSTALTQRLGDAAAQELLRAHNTIVREALKGCGGSEIKHTGDGIMASFPSASRAIECAISIQRAVSAKGDALLRMRIGLNAGEPVAEERDLFGTSVQLARRICDHAAGGTILVSNVVRELAMGKGFLFADTGEIALKGFEDPARLYEVRWREVE